MFAAGPPSVRAEPLAGSPLMQTGLIQSPGSAAFQRTRGALRLSFAKSGDQTVPVTLHQEGALKVRLPSVYGNTLREAVVINTAGGLTGGDRLDLSVSLGPDAALTIAGQACEKLYKSSGGDAVIATTLNVAPRARLEWLMQPAILFDRARVRRTVAAEIAGDAALLAVESVVFGRTAMAEDVTTGFIADAWRVRRDGVLIYADAFRLDGEIGAALDRPSVLDGQRAMASVIYVASDAQDRCGQMRDIINGLSGCTAAASAWNGILAARLLAPDGYTLTRALIDILTRFRGVKMPRVWTI